MRGALSSRQMLPAVLCCTASAARPWSALPSTSRLRCAAMWRCKNPHRTQAMDVSQLQITVEASARGGVLAILGVQDRRASWPCRCSEMRR